MKLHDLPNPEIGRQVRLGPNWGSEKGRPGIIVEVGPHPNLKSIHTYKHVRLSNGNMRYCSELPGELE